MPRKVFDSENLTYERMAGETAKAFSAFRMYRDLGPDRTMENVRISMGKPPVFLRALQELSRKYCWVDRCHLYDAELDRKELESRKQEHEKSAEFWEAQRQQSLLQNLQLAMRMRDRLGQMLEHPLTKEVMKDVNGKSYTYIIPAKWTFSTVATLAKVMAELEAATIGEALQGAADEDFDVDNATIEQLRDYINKTKGRGKP